nr:reverse transcriptase domain-containing protein [Tanacetum cinerariifolium]
MGIVVSIIHGVIKFHTTRGISTVFSTYESDKVREGLKKVKKASPADVKRILSYTNAEERVANPVMVKKSDGGWRMCVDFTDINKAFPKDCYPLPKIDWMVESLLGFHLKCFIDAYKGYHQIQMAEEDEDMIDFFAREGTFCY